MTDLDAWLDVNNPGEGARWTLTQALDLTDSGMITVSLSLLTLASATLLLRRRPQKIR